MSKKVYNTVRSFLSKQSNRENKTKLLDTVFSSNSNVNLVNEDDEKEPQTVYGKTKLDGEKFIEDNCYNYYIFRTAWLYGEGKNFVRTMIKLANSNDTVKVVNDYHKKVILKIGADSVIQPEKDTGKRLAHQMLSDFVLDYLVLSDTYSIVELLAAGPIVGETLIDLNIPQRFGINIAAIKRNYNIVVPQANTEIKEGDVLLVIGENKDISEFDHWLLHS